MTIVRGKQGFAAMTPERRREISTKGSRMAHALGRSHRFTPEEARLAGKKGGAKVSQDREHMSRIGRIGGLTHSKEHLSRIAKIPRQRFVTIEGERFPVATSVVEDD